MYSQNDKTDVFIGSWNQNSPHYLTMVGRLLKNFCQYFPWILHIAGGICVRFSKKNSENFSYYRR